jgi:hypothetical protein
MNERCVVLCVDTNVSLVRKKILQHIQPKDLVKLSLMLSLFFLLKYFNILIFLIFVLNSSEDGWWEAENAAGKQGVVPKTLLKVIT